MIASDDRNANLRAVYEQYWLHARHTENERLWFTSAYALVVGGLLAYMAHVGWNLWILVFVFLLSLLGLAMTHAMRIPFLKFSRMAERISRNEWGLKDYRRFFFFPSEKPDDTTATERSRVSGGRKLLSRLLRKFVVGTKDAIFTLHWVFTEFYAFASALTLGLIVYSHPPKFLLAVSSNRLAISVVCVVLFWAVLHFGIYIAVLRPKETKICVEEENKLKAILR